MQRRRILATAAGAAFSTLLATGHPVFAQSPPAPVAADEFRVPIAAENNVITHGVSSCPDIHFPVRGGTLPART